MAEAKTLLLDAITLPVRADKTAVYSTVVDAEDRLVAFVGMSLKSDAVASLIAESLNAAPAALPAVTVTVAFVDKDQPNGIAWCPGYPEGLPDITPLGAAPVAAPTDRSAKDYAIEHAEYMAVNAERLLSTIDALSAAELRREEHDDDDGTVADARDDVWSATRSLRSGIYEFRKRRERALSAVQPAGDVAAPPGPIDANALDAQRLDWLDEQNRRKNEYHGTKYGWQYSVNCNRIALEDHGWPARSVREAIDAAVRAAEGMK